MHLKHDALDKEIDRIFEKENTPNDALLSEIDSLARAELIVAVEEIVGKQLTNEQVYAFKTVKDIKDLLNND